MFFFKTHNDRAAATARRNGCTPKWNTHYEAWCCPCKHGIHQGDSQCSVITEHSARYVNRNWIPTKFGLWFKPEETGR